MKKIDKIILISIVVIPVAVFIGLFQWASWRYDQIEVPDFVYFAVLTKGTEISFNSDTNRLEISDEFDDRLLEAYLYQNGEHKKLTAQEIQEIELIEKYETPSSHGALFTGRDTVPETTFGLKQRTNIQVATKEGYDVMIPLRGLAGDPGFEYSFESYWVK